MRWWKQSRSWAGARDPVSLVEELVDTGPRESGADEITGPGAVQALRAGLDQVGVDIGRGSDGSHGSTASCPLPGARSSGNHEEDRKVRESAPRLRSVTRARDSSTDKGNPTPEVSLVRYPLLVRVPWSTCREQCRQHPSPPACARSRQSRQVMPRGRRDSDTVAGRG